MTADGVATGAPRGPGRTLAEQDRVERAVRSLGALFRGLAEFTPCLRVWPIFCHDKDKCVSWRRLQHAHALVQSDLLRILSATMIRPGTGSGHHLEHF